VQALLNTWLITFILVVGNGKYPDSHIRRHGRDSGNYWKPALVETEMAAMATGTMQIASFSLHVSQSSLQCMFQCTGT